MVRLLIETLRQLHIIEISDQWVRREVSGWQLLSLNDPRQQSW